MAATAATKKNASAIPNSDRTSTKAASEVTTRCSASATTVRKPPPMRSGRRPNRSDAQPTTGRIRRAAMANAPIAIPTPIESAWSGPAANREATGSTVLPAVKNTSAAANSAAKAGVRSRDGLAGRSGAATPVSVAEPDERLGSDKRHNSRRADPRDRCSPGCPAGSLLDRPNRRRTRLGATSQRTQPPGDGPSHGRWSRPARSDRTWPDRARHRDGGGDGGRRRSRAERLPASGRRSGARQGPSRAPGAVPEAPRARPSVADGGPDPDQR